MSAKKKVLMFGWEYPPYHSGGLGVACKGMAHALIDNDVHVCFVLPTTLTVTDEKVPLLFADTAISTAKKTTTHQSPHLETLARELYNPYLSSVQYEIKLAEFIQAGGTIVPRTLFEQVEHYGTLMNILPRSAFQGVDIIHAHDWLCFPAGIAAKKITGKPLIAHIHATEFDRCAGNTVNEYVYNKEREGMHIADHIITVSELTKNTVIEKYGIHKDKITVIHNGNTQPVTQVSNRFESLRGLKQGGAKIVLFAGRITIQKGVDYFIHAAQRVLEHDKGVYFIVAGTGDMEEQIKSLVKRLNISNHFLFTGYYTLEDSPTLFALADVVVVPSVSEPFGIIPLESMSHGVPIILSKQSGASEVISHALKVDFWDTEKIASDILAIIHHAPLRTTLRDEGKHQVSGITWDKAAKKIKHLYTTLS
jgi:glycosyltransferase involved in cell wall biosynthesis